MKQCKLLKISNCLFKSYSVYSNIFLPAELALKARKEIADYVSAGKDDRARIRVRS